MSRTLRSLLVAVVGGAVLVFAADRLVNSPDFPLPRDFPEYWAAGRLNLRGENPYDPVRLLAEQQIADPKRNKAVMMWNPPPSLAVYMPLGLFSARWSGLLWCGVQFAAVMLACQLLWREYAPNRPPWPGLLAGLLFVGTPWLILFGQNTGLLLLGLAGFLHFSRRGKPLTAGAFAALTALKPHLLAGFGVLLLADAVTRRGGIALAAGVSVIAVSLGVAVLANPDVVSQFLAALRDPGPNAVPLHKWMLPVPAYWLRIEFGPSQFWLQFVPCAVACVALVAWRIRAGANWDWSRAMPVVVAVSVLTTPYGGWIFDLPVLLVPVVWCVARLARADRQPLLAVFLLGQIAVMVLSFTLVGGLHDYWWVAPAALGLCLLGFVRK